MTRDGSSLFFKTAAESTWHVSPFLFFRTLDNNKYYCATLPTDTFQPGDEVQYYARIPYSDHDTTFVFADPSCDTLVHSSGLLPGPEGACGG